jgi:hypothetical protein
VGAWKGYTESRQAPWDAILLDIRGVTETGMLCGTMTIGAGGPPAPATDPNVGYPPGQNLLVSTFFTSPVVQGFAYTLLDGTMQDGRVRFTLRGNEPWRGWCALQTPIADPANNRYGCLRTYRSAMVNPSTLDCRIIEDNGTYTPIDCGKFMLCGPNSACACDAEGCDADPGMRYPFDLHFDAASADGAGPTGRARFFRSE